MINKNKTLSISIISGKGGVGKTNLALNLGYALYFAAKKVILMDCDLGLANLDVLLGMSPEHSLQDLLGDEISAKDVLVAIEEHGFDILPSASGVPELVEMDEDTQDVMFRKLLELAGQYDFLIQDLGAGISNTVLSFASLTQLRVIIVTPEPTSLTDGYAVIKVLANQYNVRDFLVVVNQASNAEEAKQTFDRLNAACKNFLDIELVSLGHIRYDHHLPDSVRKQTPLLKLSPNCPAGMDIQAIASKILHYRQDNIEKIGGREILKNISHTSE